MTSVLVPTSTSHHPPQGDCCILVVIKVPECLPSLLGYHATMATPINVSQFDTDLYPILVDNCTSQQLQTMLATSKIFVCLSPVTIMTPQGKNKWTNDYRKELDTFVLMLKMMMTVNCMQSASATVHMHLKGVLGCLPAVSAALCTGGKRLSPCPWQKSKCCHVNGTSTKCHTHLALIHEKKCYFQLIVASHLTSTAKYLKIIQIHWNYHICPRSSNLE